MNSPSKIIQTQNINDVMDEYSEKVYLLAYSFLKDKGLAEDVSQEVFLKCYRYLGQFKGNSELSTWIYRITVNASKDALSKRKKQSFFLPHYFMEKMTNTPSVESEFMQKTEEEKLLNMVLNLPKKYKEILVLHYFQELKTSDIAVVLELSENTVKTRLVRGREKLKKKGEFFDE